MSDDHDGTGPARSPGHVDPPFSQSTFRDHLQPDSQNLTQSPSSPPPPQPTVIQDVPPWDFLGKQFETLIMAVNTLNTTMMAQSSTMTDMKHTIESQKEITERQQKTTDIHPTKLSILARDAEKDDKPYDEKPLNDESTTRALYEMAVGKTKEKADRWNGRIDNTLIFVALFSAVVSGFAVMQTQVIAPSPTTTNNSSSNATTSPPPLPASSDEWVCALYYLSLISSISVAVLCVLAREWVRKLTIMPRLPTWKAKTLWHVTRVKRSEGWIVAVMEIIYRSLLISIGLFIAGLLYQLRNLSISFEQNAPILVATWASGIVLASAVLLVIAATVLHAVRYEGSVFEGRASRVITGDIDIGWPKGMKSGCAKIRELVSRGWRRIGGVALMERLTGCWETIRKSVGIKKRKESILVHRSRDKSRWKRITKALRKGSQWMKSRQIKVDRDSRDELINAYLELIADASDPILLKRAAASFCYREWVQHGDRSINQLSKVLSRLTATDTSFRVRETVNMQISRFRAWITERRSQMEENRKTRAQEDGWARQYGLYMARSKEREKEEEEEHRAIELTKFLISQRTDNISEHFTPTWENCSDILDLISLPFDKFIAKCLCINDHSMNLGDHDLVFFYSVEHCKDLLRAKKSDDLARIVSHVDLCSALRSFVHAKFYDAWYDCVLTLIIGDRRTEALCLLAQFLSTTQYWSDLHPGGASAVFVVAAGSLPQFPPDLDLFPIVAHIGRHPSWWNWREASQTAIAYLAQRDISTISVSAGIHHFLLQCVHLEMSPPSWSSEIRRAPQETRNTASTLLNQYEAFFASNIRLPPSPTIPSSDDIISPNTQNPSLNFPLLSHSDSLDEPIPSLPNHTLEDPNHPTIPSVQVNHPSLPSTSSAFLSTDHHVVDMTDVAI
ncbi:hypothetical protein SISNIDRAFT_491424 [Sistotremastrum niveocremeum HHB9708]|uniref:DUF6535 domain-containing protein n=1 Tax=Sistotremastrum niveocremeum HHB9708 TaxID=1314777 RepID=A0A164MTM4_9AGAM|nr:hypothetical protein SISNIDRAFT_491424 [Sistotremastrum niveocremeum HHB9708]